jgi:hypothetical protein
MNIGKYFRLLRRGKQLNWQRGQLLSYDLDRQGSTKIVEYQDRWTKTPSREPIRLDDTGGHT